MTIVGFFSGCEIAPIQRVESLCEIAPIQRVESLFQYTGVLVLVGERSAPLH